MNTMNNLEGRVFTENDDYVSIPRAEYEKLKEAELWQEAVDESGIEHVPEWEYVSAAYQRLKEERA